MTQPYEALYLAPHLDDVTLSCGGQVAQRTARGERVLIVTVMAGDPPSGGLSAYAQQLHQRWQLEQTAVATRRAEDHVACALLGADYTHWEIPDCVYRLDPQTNTALYQTETAIFATIHPLDKPLVAHLAGRLAQLPPARQVIAPLAVGRHVDHQLTRLAAEAWCDEASLTYYEDYPYVQTPSTLEQQIDPKQWRAETIRLTAQNLRDKYEAIAAFASQLSSFFDDQADLERQVGGYAQTVGGERLWHRST